MNNTAQSMTTNPQDQLARLESLLDRWARLEKRWQPWLEQIEQAQPLTGMLGDMFDEFGARSQAEGIGLEMAAKNLLNLTLRLSQELGPAETERLVRLLRLVSQNPHLIPLLEKLGQAGLPAPGEKTSGSAQPTIGIFGLMRALKEPQIQKTVAWLLAAARRFDGGS